TLLNFAGSEFVPKYTFKEKQEIKLINIGNLKPNKNQEAAIKALAELKHLNIMLDIYGEGGLRPYLQELITNTGAKVTLKGKAEITTDLFSKYDAFLMTSSNEGMPISLLEA